MTKYFIVYSSQKKTFGVSLKLGSMWYTIFPDGSTSFDTDLVKYSNVDDPKFRDVMISNIARKFEIPPHALKNYLDKIPNSDEWTAEDIETEVRMNRNIILSPESGEVSPVTTDEEEPKSEYNVLEHFSIVDSLDVSPTDDDSDINPGKKYITSYDSTNLVHTIFNALSAESKAQLAQEFLLFLHLLTSRDVKNPIIDISLTSAGRNWYVFLKNYPDHKLVLETFYNPEQLITNLQQYASNVFSTLFKSYSEQTAKYGYPVKLSKAVETQLISRINEKIQSVIKNINQNSFPYLSGILFQPIFNALSDAFLSKYITLPPTTPRLSREISQYISKMNSELEPVRESLARLFKFIQNNPPVVLSESKNLNEIFTTISNKVIHELEQSPHLQELKNKYKNFDFNRWWSDVKQTLTELQTFDQLVTSDSPDFALYESLGDLIKTQLQNLFSQLEYDFEFNIPRKNKYTLSPYYSHEQLDEFKILSHIKNKAIQILYKLDHGVRERLDVDEKLEKLVLDSMKQFKDPDHISKNYKKKLIDEIINDAKNLLTKILQKSTVSELEKYLWRVHMSTTTGLEKVKDPDIAQQISQVSNRFIEIIRDQTPPSGTVITINGSKFIVVGSSNDTLYLTDFDELQQSQCAELISSPKTIEYSIDTFDSGMILRKCSVDNLVVRASRCASCPYGLTYGSCATCFYDKYMRKIASHNTTSPLSVKIGNYEFIDRIMECMDLVPDVNSNEPLTVCDRVMKKGSLVCGTVSSINPDYSVVVLWDNGLESISWPMELQRIKE